MNCPDKKEGKSDSKKNEEAGTSTDFKGKKKVNAGLVPDLLGVQTEDESSELCRAWGKVRDQEALIFFDNGAKANFISPELAAKLGVKPEEMGPQLEAALAAPGMGVAVTPIIGKLRLHVQGYVGQEDFYIMPLEGCDVLLGMPWYFKNDVQFQSRAKKLIFQYKGRNIVIDVKLKGE